jgi:transposase
VKFPLPHPGITWTRVPIDGTQLTDLEAVFRNLKSELGLRPVYLYKEDRGNSHLFITVLAYQAVQVLRRKLKLQDHQC